MCTLPMLEEQRSTSRTVPLQRIATFGTLFVTVCSPSLQRSCYTNISQSLMLLPIWFPNWESLTALPDSPRWPLLATYSMHGTSLDYLSEIFASVTVDLGRRHLCSAVCGDIVVLRTNKTSGHCSFAVKEQVIWNGLPTAVCYMDLSL